MDCRRGDRRMAYGDTDLVKSAHYIARGEEPSDAGLHHAIDYEFAILIHGRVQLHG
jgi:hypothetical protein